MYNTLIRWCLAGKPFVGGPDELPEIVELCKGNVISAANTGIAALLLIGGGTVHRQFNVPNDVSDDTIPRINVASGRAEQIRNADLIIIDVGVRYLIVNYPFSCNIFLFKEISMLSKKVFNYLNRFLKDVCGNQKVFGGKTVVLGGDWKQLPPVVGHGTREDQIHESIKMDPLFKAHFESLRFEFMSHFFKYPYF